MLGERALAVTAETATLAPRELSYAKELARRIGVRHTLVRYDDLQNEHLVENGPSRCYYCREDLSVHLTRIAKEEGIEVIVDGVIADDLTGYRPGVKALDKAGILHPLCDLGFSKKDVRGVAQVLGLSSAGKPSNACLASRFQYGIRITREALIRVAQAESFVMELAGVRQVRIRVHGEIARIEVGKEERRLLLDEAVLDKIADALKKLGFNYVTLDLHGYRSGSMDEVLGEKLVQIKGPNGTPQ